MNNRTFLVLMHYPTIDRLGKTITSAITGLDMHDFARLAKTYGLGGVYVQTNLPQQIALIKRLLGHWVDGRGGEMNANRKDALEGLLFRESLEVIIAEMEDKYGQPPVVAVTSARDIGITPMDFLKAKEEIEKLDERPLLILFGTASGLAPEVFDLCNWVLEPIGSPSGYNHLSVRSAASITVDRLFG